MSLFIKHIFENIKLLNFQLLEDIKNKDERKMVNWETVRIICKYMAKDIHNS